MKSFATQTETLELEEVEVRTDVGCVLMLFDDDINTFDHVIESLIQVAGLEPVQAEQITFLVHFKGKCDVKRGRRESLKPICAGLQQKGLTARII
jgi:ATP-dependent Clp protease adaptor protein ClpS